MKKLLLLLALILLPAQSFAATCFWVGGTGNANDAAHWSNASGGAGSTCAGAGGVPYTGSDSATIDASSGAGTVTFNVSANSTGTLTTGAMGMTLADGGNDQTWGSVSITGSGTRTYNLTAAKWTVTGTGTVWNAATTTNLTNTSMPTLIELSSTASPTFNGGGLTYNDVTFSGAGSTSVAISATSTYRDLTVTNTTTLSQNTTASTARNISITAGTFGGNATWLASGNLSITCTTCTATGLLTLNGSSGTQALTIAGTGYPAALTINNSGATAIVTTSGWTPAGAITVTATSGVTFNGSAIVATSTFAHTAGSVTINVPMTTTTYSSSNANTRSLTLARPWTLTGTGTVFNNSTSTNATYTCTPGGYFAVTDTSTTSKTVIYSGSEILKCIKYAGPTTTKGWTVTP